MLNPFLLTIFLLIVKINIAQNCGVERWSIKTLSDSDTIKINFNEVIKSTVKEQVSLEKTKGKINSRLASETKVYSINCFIVGYKKEDDKDIHIIIEDVETDETMVAEIPSQECFEIRSTSRYLLFKELNEWFIKNIGHPSSKFIFLEKHIPVTITGVGFFDFIHGQKGMASNGREIHPVLSIKIN